MKRRESTKTEPTKKRSRDEMLCPRCKWIARRVKRNRFDRFLSGLIPLRRYRCIRCKWSGVRFAR